MIDHSLTYKEFKLRNLPHMVRLKRIRKILDANKIIFNGKTYLDIGCSNGYISNLIQKSYKFSCSKGMDHNIDNLEIAAQKYHQIDFEFIDLNEFNNTKNEKYDLVTCFETLEHVGNLENGILSVLSFSKNESFTLISVPIEIGLIGLIKFILKKIHGYNLGELPNHVSTFTYFKDLFLNRDISIYRDKRNGWSTHFGFDYRNIDKYLSQNNIKFITKNSIFTRFYFIKRQEFNHSIKTNIV